MSEWQNDCAWSPEIDGCEVSEGGWRLNREKQLIECAWQRKADGLVFYARVSALEPRELQAGAIAHAQRDMREYIALVPLGGWDMSRGEGEPGMGVTFDRIGPFEGTITSVDVNASEYTVTLKVPFDACSRNLRRAAFEDANGAPV